MLYPAIPTVARIARRLPPLARRLGWLLMDLLMCYAIALCLAPFFVELLLTWSESEAQDAALLAPAIFVAKLATERAKQRLAEDARGNSKSHSED